MFWTSMTTETSKILHSRNCTSNCSNSSRVLEFSRTLSNPCSQNIELNNPDYAYALSCCVRLYHAWFKISVYIMRGSKFSLSCAVQQNFTLFYCFLVILACLSKLRVEWCPFSRLHICLKVAAWSLTSSVHAPPRLSCY